MLAGGFGAKGPIGVMGKMLGEPGGGLWLLLGTLG